MIIVVADDFTGAAEVAGIAWRYGLQTILQSDMVLSEAADVLIIDTASRSMPEADARKSSAQISQTIKGSHSDWIFKKVDSVLRGNIIAELDSMISELGNEQVLLIANNPSVGRIIKDRRFYIENIEIHLTDFKHDPEFPLQSSGVSDILGQSNMLPVKFLKKTEHMNGRGIFIPEIKTLEDIKQRALEIDDKTMLAGGSDFFEVLLDVKKLYKKFENKPDINDDQKRFVIMASTTDISRKTVLEFQNKGVAVCSLPCQTLQSSVLTDKCLIQWATNIIAAFKKNRTVVSAILHPINKEHGLPNNLNHFIAKMVRQVLHKTDVKNLFIEGGATASHLIRFMGWHQFRPLFEYSKAVVKLQIDQESGRILVVKPGSYAWPEEILGNIYH